MAIKKTSAKKLKKAAVATKNKVSAKVKKTTSAMVSKAKKVKAIKETQNKTEVFKELAQITGLTKSQVESVFDANQTLMKAHLAKNGSGQYTIPKTGIKVKRVRKKATKQRKMVSPLNQMEFVIPAKPSRDVVKLYALKIAKELVE